MVSSKRYGVDRRIDDDKRQVYDLNYFIAGGRERRRGKERRDIRERRVGWVKADDWRSVYLGNLVCADDFKSREDTGLPHRYKIAQSLRNIDDKRLFDRFLVQEFAYAVLRPSSKCVGQIVDVSRGGVSFRYPDTGIEDDKVTYQHLDIFLVGDDFYIERIPFKTVSERRLEIDLPDHTLSMIQCGVMFDTLSMEQEERLAILIDKYTRGRF